MRVTLITNTLAMRAAATIKANGRTTRRQLINAVMQLCDPAFTTQVYLTATRPKAIQNLIEFPVDFFDQYQEWLDSILHPFEGASTSTRTARFIGLISRTTWAGDLLESYLLLRLFDFYFAPGKGKKVRQQVIAEIVEYRLQVALQDEAAQGEFEKFANSLD